MQKLATSGVPPGLICEAMFFSCLIDCVASFQWGRPGVTGRSGRGE